MAGLPWVITFALFALLGMRRGWGWLVVLSVFLMGVSAAHTDIAASLNGLARNTVATIWSSVVSLLNSAVD